MIDVGAWLHGLGLECYATAFAQHDVGPEVLPNLTENDLTLLGVVSVGHRRRLLAAVRSLQADRATLPKAAAERRLLTVMFCDLVGSTDLSSQLDPEEMRDVIGAYQAAVVAEIERHDGNVAKFLGDGVLAYFGWPHALEDAAERTVLAGLGAVRAVATLRNPSGERLAARVGISSGLVVVGDLLGAGAAREEAIVGDTPNLAARLQTLAASGEVLIGPNTRRLIGGMFDLDELDRLVLKGIRAPVQAYSVRGEARVESRFEATRGRHIAPLVGREAELACLRRAWSSIQGGDGQVILMVGEPGIGKSRLTLALADEISTAGGLVLRYFSSSHHTGTALFPVIEQIRRAARLESQQPATRQVELLEALLGCAVAETAALVPLFASLLNIPPDGAYTPPVLGPAALKARTLQALVAQLVGLAEQGPVLVTFEDLHWLDPTTTELLDLVAAATAAWPVLLLATARPEFVPPWKGFQQLDLLKLDRPHSEAVLRQLIGGKSLPEALERDIIAKTDGVPLFIEELTKSVLEADWLAEVSGAYQLTRPIRALAVPDSLQGSLLARLDRLGASKNVAQIGAVIGRDFSYRLLAAVADLPDAQLERALGSLIHAELIQRRSEGRDVLYSFKHALVRDAAYESLLRSRRRTLHGCIVAAVEHDFPQIATSQPELIARHSAAAGLIEKAVAYWQLAGEQTVRHAANREAADHFRNALQQNELLPESAQRDRTELAILSQLGPALMNLHGWPAQDVGEVFERAGRTARRLELSADLAPPLVGMWLFHLAKGQFDRADAITHELFGVAEHLDDPSLLLQAHHAAWPTAFLRGRLTGAAGHIRSALALYDERRHERHRFTFLGHDPAVCAYSIGAVVHSVRGRGRTALHYERKGIDLARRLGHAPSLAHTLWFVAEARVARGDTANAGEVVRELLALGEEQRLPQPWATAVMFQGWLLTRSGDPAAGLAMVRDGLSRWNALGAKSYLPRAHCLLAECLLRAHRHAEAGEAIERALDAADDTGEQWCAARIHILQAELERATGVDETKAEATLCTALKLAQKQGARLWMLLAASELTRMWLRRGERQRGHDLLAPIRAGMATNFPSPYAREADSLLATIQ